MMVARGVTLAADASATTTAWIAAVAALGGVALTSVVALATAVLNHRWQAQAAERQARQERFRQLRQERRETYVQYWRAENGLVHQIGLLHGEMAALDPAPATRLQAQSRIPPALAEGIHEAELAWRQAADALFLVGGPDVVAAGTTRLRATNARLNAAWEGRHGDGGGTYFALNEAMRAELELNEPAAGAT